MVTDIDGTFGGWTSGGKKNTQDLMNKKDQIKSSTTLHLSQSV